MRKVDGLANARRQANRLAKGEPGSAVIPPSSFGNSRLDCGISYAAVPAGTARKDQLGELPWGAGSQRAKPSYAELIYPDLYSAFRTLRRVHAG